MEDYDQWILVTNPLNIFNDGHSKVFWNYTRQENLELHTDYYIWIKICI